MTASGFWSVPSIEEHQHYKQRNPPWIKLHAKVLEDYQFTTLPDEAKALLMLMWLLASRTGNAIPDDPGWIVGKLGLAASAGDTKANLHLLATRKLLVLSPCASKTLADDACISRERVEGETEQRRVEGESERDGAVAPAPAGAPVPKAKKKKPMLDGDVEVNIACASVGASARLRSAMLNYRGARAKNRFPVWDAKKWVEHLRLGGGDELCLIMAFDLSARSGWRSVHPKPGQRNGKALTPRELAHKALQEVHDEAKARGI